MIKTALQKIDQKQIIYFEHDADWRQAVQRLLERESTRLTSELLTELIAFQNLKLQPR